MQRLVASAEAHLRDGLGPARKVQEYAMNPDAVVAEHGRHSADQRGKFAVDLRAVEFAMKSNVTSIGRKPTATPLQVGRTHSAVERFAFQPDPARRFMR
jgi:hypothetical protein